MKSENSGNFRHYGAIAHITNRPVPQEVGSMVTEDLEEHIQGETRKADSDGGREELVPSLSREEIAFLRERSLDSRSVTVLSSLSPAEIKIVRRLIQCRQEEERLVNPVLPSFVIDDSVAGVDLFDVIDEDVDADDDGLAKSKRMRQEHRWPFKRNNNDDNTDESKVEKEIFFEAISCHDKGESHEGFVRAIACYRMVIVTEPATAEDRMFHMFALVNLGILRMTSVEFKNEHEAIHCFKKGAMMYGEPVSMYFYGQALVYGVGGVRRDIARGIGFLNQAGAKGIGQSFFELGSIYERGVRSFTGGSIEKNEARAREFYKAAGKSYMSDTRPLGDWTCKLYAVQTFTADMFYLQDLLPTDVWHGVEDVIGSVVGNRFNWSIAGQAFLFGAASALSSNKQPDHYLPLLALLPLLGMILAFFSMLHIIEAMYRNDRRRGSLLEMLDAKIMAYCHHVAAAEKAAKDNEERFKDCSKEISIKRQKLEHHELAINRLKSLSTFIEAMILVMASAFFAAWLILLLNEVVQFTHRCSNWWLSICMESSIT